MKKQAITVFILISFLSMAIVSCEDVATLFHGPEPEAPPVTCTVTFHAN
jgi:hypothetical protein